MESKTRRKHDDTFTSSKGKSQTCSKKKNTSHFISGVSTFLLIGHKNTETCRDIFQVDEGKISRIMEGG